MNNLGIVSYYTVSTGITFFSNSFRSWANYFETLSAPTMLGIIVASVILILILFGDPRGKRKWFVTQLEKFPGPMAFPLIGNAPDLLFPPEEIFSWMENVYHEWGDIVRFWVLGNPKVFVNSYDIAMQLLTRKNFLLKSEEFVPLSPIAEHSLPGATPEVHPIRRRMLAPGFSRQKVEESINIFAKNAIQTCDKLKGMSESNAVFNALSYTGLCSYKIGCETSFGIEIMKNLCENDYREQMEAWHTMLVHIVRRSLQPWFTYDFIYNLTPGGKQVQKCFRVINRFAENAISIRRTRRRYLSTQTRSQNERSAFILNESLDSAKSNQTHHECFLDLLLDLEERKELTQTAVLHELNIFIVAGYDTTGTTAGWVLHFLSSYPEHQDKVVEELQEIFADHPRPLTSSSISVSDTKRMKYLECCIKETLRICPVLPWLLRRTNEDIVLNDGRIIPAGVDVPINTYVIHRDPSKFPKPEEFRPERHSVEKSSSSPRSPMLPFGAGPRICPGMLFAMQELKVMLTHLLLEYSWESTDDPKKIKHLFQGVLLPEKGINVKIKKR